MDSDFSNRPRKKKGELKNTCAARLSAAITGVGGGKGSVFAA